MAVGVANVRHREDGLRAESMLNAQAVLAAGRQLVVGAINAGKARSVDWPNGLSAGFGRNTRIRQLCVVQSDAQAKGNVRAGVVHVVALNALVHEAKTAANDGLAVSGEVIGKAKTRTESCPVVIHQALGNAILSRDADTVQVKRYARKNWVGAGAKTRTRRINGAIRKDDRSVGGLIETWVKVPHAVIGFIRVRYAVPAQAEVQGQATRCAPVILNVSSPGNVVPQAVVLHREFVVALR